MKNQLSIGGRSLVFNFLFVFLSITGLIFILLGSHPSQIENFTLFNFIGYITLTLSIGGLILFQGNLLMANIARWLVGSIFIFSGIIKLNDPVGFAIKLEEYFQDGALAYRIKEWFGAPGFSLEFLQDYAFFLAIVLTAIELILGVFLIIGAKMRSVAFFLLGIMLFFTFLTWHTASCDPNSSYWDENTYPLNDLRIQKILSNPKADPSIKIVDRTDLSVTVLEQKKPQCVTDCGCFGDALKGSIGRSLTPLESLFKDLILLYLTIWILIARKRIQPNFRNQNIQYLLAFLGLIILLSWLFSWYFPIGFSLFLILGSLWMNRSGGPLLGNYFGSALFILVSFSIVLIYVLRHDPIKDFRPFAIGNDLNEKMTDGKPGVYKVEYLIKNLKTGDNRSYSDKEYFNDAALWDTLNYQIIKQIQKEISPEIPASIGMQFNPLLVLNELSLSSLNDYSLRTVFSKYPKTAVRVNNTETSKDSIVSWNTFNSSNFNKTNYSYLSMVNSDDAYSNAIPFRDIMNNYDQVVLIVSENINTANWSDFEEWKEMIQFYRNNKVPFFLITRCSLKEQAEFKKNLGFPIIVLQNYDETGLKIISRSNPSLLILKKGVVVEKYTSYGLPNIEDLKSILQ
jgi:uncharacterized membrane protein YphA (DoxX/SURF4 family)